jgi:hypothetical protein
MQPSVVSFLERHRPLKMTATASVATMPIVGSMTATQRTTTPRHVIIVPDRAWCVCALVHIPLEFSRASSRGAVWFRKVSRGMISLNAAEATLQHDTAI